MLSEAERRFILPANNITVRVNWLLDIIRMVTTLKCLRFLIGCDLESRATAAHYDHSHASRLRKALLHKGEGEIKCGDMSWEEFDEKTLCTVVKVVTSSAKSRETLAYTTEDRRSLTSAAKDGNTVREVVLKIASVFEAGFDID
jgi:hypothetical protein